MANALRSFQDGKVALRQLALQEVPKFREEFGYSIHERHWRRIFQRTIARDAGHHQWERLDLYLDEPRPRKSEQSVRIDVKPAEAVLLGYSSKISDVGDPTPKEKALFWQVSFEQMHQLVEAGVTECRARKAVRQILWKCGVKMAKNEVSLAQLWRTYEAKWREAQGALTVLVDKRSSNSGNYRSPELPQRDIDQVIARAVRRGGRISQAWREVLAEGRLSKQITAYYDGLQPASKSYVPRRIREAARHDVRLLKDMHHGSRRARLNEAYVSRSWDDVAAGDWFQADDVTFNAYYYAPNEKGGTTLMRGQVLLMIDLRSTRILGFAMLDRRNYNAQAIRTLITRVCESFGLPRRGFYFERGIWEKSRLLVGDRNAEAMSWTESEAGLRELGLIFKHAVLPRAKPIERVIGEIQNLLDGTPGDAGRREATAGFERLQKKKRLVEAGKLPASDFFLSHSQMEGAIAEACKTYNEARNDGKMTGGLTSEKAWEHYQSTPLVRLPQEARYLLAHHKRPLTVGRNGISLRFGKESFVYRNAETGRLRGQRVLAWFNPDMPELLAVTDMDRENCFTVERAQEVPAMDATPEALEEELSRVDAHNAYARHRYRILSSKIDVPFRVTFVDRPTVELGQEIEGQAQQAKRAQSDRRTRTKKIRSDLTKLGFGVGGGEDFTDDQVEGVKTLKKLFSDK